MKKLGSYKPTPTCLELRLIVVVVLMNHGMDPEDAYIVDFS